MTWLKQAARQFAAQSKAAERERKARTEWGVFRWHADPRYTRDEALRIFKREADARKYARANDLVERPLERESRARRNPAPRSSAQLAQAGELFEGFTGHRARVGSKLDAGRALGLPIQSGRKIPLVAFGELLEVKYRTIRDGKEEFYRHPFKAASRPLLAARHDGKRVYIVGGRYRFTDRGIVDQ